jgi:CubicO group peptidase (beta-lactamase class C family)
MGALDDWLNARLAQYDAPGVPGGVIALCQGGEIAYTRTFGRANLEFDIPWTLDTRYRVASVTKQFVGAVALLLERAGALRLDDDIRRYLPELPKFDAPISLRQLLAMTSGIRHEEAALMSFLGETAGSLEDLYAIVTRSPLHFDTGSYALYSCANYRLAARILERASGQTLNELLQRLILAPLGMTRSLSHPDYDLALPELACLYHPDGGCYRREQSAMQMSGDGALIATARDLARWLGSLQQDSLGVSAQLTTPSPLPAGRRSNYGLGIGLTRYRGLRVWEHGGSFGSYLFQLPERDFGVILLCNRLDIDRWTLARELADLWLYGESASAACWLSYATQHGDDQLLPHTGRYVHCETGYTVTLELWRGALWAEVLGASEALEPTGPLSFASASPASAFRLRLAQDADSLDADMGRQGWLTFGRVAPELGLEDATPYLGAYANDELAGVQVIDEAAGALRLTVRHGRVVKLQQRLTPLAPDVFTADALALKFVRDRAGRVVGVRESINRARDLYFYRMNGSGGATC